MSKGGQFERDVCRQLSLWWSSGERDDLLWRTGGSGGRATTRARKNLATCNQHGDICAMDKSVEPLLKVFTFELKRGYSRQFISQLFERTDRSAIQQWEKWIQQARESAKKAGTPYWLIISRKNNLDGIVVMPLLAYGALRERSCLFEMEGPILEIRNCLVRKKNFKPKQLSLMAVKLSDFINRVSPKAIKDMAKEL